MNNWIPILALAFSGCAGALLVTLAKLDEQKQKTADEHANYIAALNLHNAVALKLERSKVRAECSADAVMWYAEMLMDTKKERDNLQDRLSALLCPSNNHIWKDGRCVKCWRVQE